VLIAKKIIWPRRHVSVRFIIDSLAVAYFFMPMHLPLQKHFVVALGPVDYGCAALGGQAG